MSRPHWVCLRSWRVCFPCLHCLGSRLLGQGQSEAGPGLYALPRSKPLRFRYSGSPQRCRLSWACVLCSSRVRAAQVTRCLPNVVTATYCLPRPCRSVFWVYNQRTFSGVPCVSSGADLWLRLPPADVDRPESQKVLVSNEACLQFGSCCLSGALIAPFPLWLPLPACLWWGIGQSTAG